MSSLATPVMNAARPMTDAELDQLSINTIRTLSIDAVQQAKSGHPGTGPGKEIVFLVRRDKSNDSPFPYD